MLARFHHWCSRLNQGVEFLLFALGLSMALLVAVQVFCRYVLNSSLFWSEELARYLLVWLSFLGATVAYYRGLHPGIDVLTSRLPRPARLFAHRFVQLVTMSLALVMIVAGIRFAWFVRHQISPALSLPKWTVLTVIPTSGLLLLLYGLLFFFHPPSQDSGP